MSPSKNTPQVNAEHHAKAADCCDKAAEEHRNAAKCCTSGDAKKAEEHAKQAQSHCSKAHDHGKHTLSA